MKKLLQGIFLILRLVFFIIFMLIAGLWLFTDLNEFKPQLVHWLQNVTGKKVDISGDIELAFFPEFKIHLGKSVLYNSSKFSESIFVELDSADVSAKFIPLWFGKIDAKTISVNGLKMYFSKNKQGQANWQDFVSPKHSDDASFKQSIQKVLALYKIEGLKLEEGYARYEDQVSGRILELQKISFLMGNPQVDQVVPVMLSFTVHQNDQAFARQVRIKTEILVDSALSVVQGNNFNLSSTALDGKEFKFDLNIAKVSYQLDKQNFDISGLHFHTEPLNLYSNLNGSFQNGHFDLQGAVKIPKFNLKQLLTEWCCILPAMRDINALSQLSADFGLQADQNSVQFKQVAMQLEQTLFKGSGDISNFADPVINFAMNADKLDLDRYLPSKTNSSESISKHLSPSELAVHMGSLEGLLSMLKAVHGKISLTIQQLTSNQVVMQGVSLELQ